MSAEAPPSGRISLRSGRFLAYLTAQFLGAFNDNAFKMAIVALAMALHKDEATRTGYSNFATFLMPLPFILFSPVAGYLADRFPKHRVLLWTKVPEILAMSLGILGFLRQDVHFLLGVLFVMEAQSAFFSPAKYGLLAETVEDRDLSMANGVVHMTTNVAVLLGLVAGTLVFHRFERDPGWIGGCLTIVAFAGTLAVLLVPKGPAGNPAARPAWNPFSSSAADLREVRRIPGLLHTLVGVAYCTFLAAIFLGLLPIYGANVLGMPEKRAELLAAVLAIGVGVGSVVAGKLSHGKVELGLVPLGAVGMGLVSLDLVFVGQDAWFVGGWPVRVVADLLLLGAASGFYLIPLNALIQQRSPEGEKGRLIAFGNILSFSAMIVAAGFVFLLKHFGVSTKGVFGILAVVTLAGTAYILRLLPDYFVRLVLWILTNTVYRIRVVGERNVPHQGALLVANHVSWVDALLVGAASGRMVRFMMWRPFFESRLLGWFFRAMHAIPVAAGDPPKKVQESLERARAEIEQGHVVCIFAEGSITRTGNLLRFRKGFERIVKGLDCPVVPVCLDGVWGSIFSYDAGKVLLKWPKRFPYPVTVLFGEPLPSTATAPEVRAKVQELAVEGFALRKASQRPLHVEFLHAARRFAGRPFVADSLKQSLTFGRAAAAALALRDRLFAGSRGKDENVGILLPPGVGGVLANLAAALAGKVSVNLNYTASAEALRYAVEHAEIRRILTSRKFLEKIGDLPGLEGAEKVFLEDVLPGLSKPRALLYLSLLRILPAGLFARLAVDGPRSDMDRTATILFSSGSTGTPKGVILTHHNVVSNIEAFRQVFPAGPGDCVLGVLPFFHSFGFTGTLWLPALAGLRVVYHANPLDARTVGKLSAEHGVSVLLATPTFLSAYTRRIEPESLRRLRHVVVGAEKLTEAVREAFRAKYGVEPLEGYGATECAPIVSINVPDAREGRERQPGRKPGSIGQPLPGISVRIVDPATREPAPPGKEGLLLVKGPNVMKGYLKDPGRTAQALADGWYDTGDIVSMDEDGFLTIVDRLARFAKIAGEMVPLGGVEEAVLEAMQGSGVRGQGSERETEGPEVCVTSVPDEAKGEKVVVLYRRGALDPKAVSERLAASGLPNLWIPKPDAFREVDAIPLLGTGKVDLRRARELAAAL